MLGGLGDAFKEWGNSIPDLDNDTVVDDTAASPNPEAASSPVPAPTQPSGSPPVSTPITDSSQQPTGDYLFASDREYITDAYLNTQSREQVRLILNEMYARHGYIFSIEQYRNYFSAKSWYVPRYSSAAEAESYFNSIEMQNKQTIVNYETVRGWR